MSHRKLGLLLGVVLVTAAILTSAASAAGGAATVQPQVINNASLQAQTTTIGGANPLSTTRTVAHWFGSTLNPNDGVTYGYNMVGADPNTCSGSGPPPGRRSESSGRPSIRNRARRRTMSRKRFVVMRCNQPSKVPGL